MRRSPETHTLAILRLEIGLTQGDLANLLGYARQTIQAIELCKLNLSDKLAERISFETGVSVGWLLDNNTAAPIADSRNKPWTVATFVQRQAHNKKPKSESRDVTHVHTMFKMAVLRVAGVMLSAVERDKFQLCDYKVGKFLDEFEAEFGSSDGCMMKEPDGRTKYPQKPASVDKLFVQSLELIASKNRTTRK